MRASTINALAFLAGYFITRLFFPRSNPHPNAMPSSANTRPTRADRRNMKTAKTAKPTYARDRDPAPAAPKATEAEDDAFNDSYQIARQRSMAAHPSNFRNYDDVVYRSEYETDLWGNDPTDLSALDNPLDGTDPLPDIDDEEELDEDEVAEALDDLATMTLAARIYVSDNTDDEDRTLLEACEYAFRNIEDWRFIAENTPVEQLCLPTVGTETDTVLAAAQLSELARISGITEEMIEAGNEGLAELLQRFRVVSTSKERQDLNRRILSRYDEMVIESWHRANDGEPIESIVGIMLLGRAIVNELALMGIDV